MFKKIASNTFILLIIAFVLFQLGRYFYFQPSVIQGEDSPNFTAELLNGEEMQLSDLRGKYVLVDFWGSWCAPCRRENPQLVQFQQKYKDTPFKKANGLEVVSVAIERREASWKKAIQADGLNWKYHILDKATDMRFFDSPIAGIFGVKEVPSKFLLNEKGQIIAVNKSFKEMDELLQKRVR